MSATPLDRLRAAPSIPSPVLDVLATLQRAGYAAYLAGGCVRDLVLGRAPQDFDVATAARPERVLELFPKVIPTGLQHGTVTVVTAAGHVEVTTFRGEADYVDGRRPGKVEFHDDVHADLARRDFTINALAWDPLHADLRDDFDGAGDLDRRLVRAVGDARARFSEDGLRPLRAVRFASMLGFTIDPATRAAIPDTLPTFRKVAIERVREELAKLLLKSPVPSVGLCLLAETGLLAEFGPELAALPHERASGTRHDRWTHTTRVVDRTPARARVRWAALLHALDAPATVKEILERWRLPRVEIDAVVHLLSVTPWDLDADWTDARLRRALAETKPEALADLLDLRRAVLAAAHPEQLAAFDALRTRLEDELARRPPLAVKDLAVTGTDVMEALGEGQGRRVGLVLRMLLEHVLDHPEDNARDVLLARVAGIRG